MSPLTALRRRDAESRVCARPEQEDRDYGRTHGPTRRRQRAAVRRQGDGPGGEGSGRITCSTDSAAPMLAAAAQPRRPRRYKRNAASADASPSGT